MEKNISGIYKNAQSAHHGLELIRELLVELEALAHSASEILKDMPYTRRELDTLDTSPEELEEQPASNSVLSVGRIQSLVTATAQRARSILEVTDKLILHTRPARLSRTGSSSGSSRASDFWADAIHWTPKMSSYRLSMPKLTNSDK